MPEIDRNLSKSIKHPVLTANLLLKAINLLSQYHLTFNNQKSYFQAIIVGAH